MHNQQLDTAVINGLVVDSKQIACADVLIKDGKIAGLSQNGEVHPAARVIDASGNYVLPGIIDAHLHPVYADRIDTLSKAAACEGITTLIPYIGAVKAWGKTGGLLASIDDFIDEGEQTSHVDFAIHCTLMHDDLEEVDQSIPMLIERGIVSFKAFMAYAKRGMKLEDRELLKIMRLIAEHGGLLAAHAENGDIIDYMEAHFIKEAKETPEYFAASHPNLSEAEAIFRLLTLAQVTNCPIYIPHISAAESMDVLALFKKWDMVEFYTETCPHYLTLTSEDISKRGAIAKMAPPVRRQADIDTLWRAAAEGNIDVIGSDAAGNPIEANEPLWDKIFEAPNGIPGLDTLFKMIYEEGVNKGRLTLPALVSLLCEKPAKIFGLYPQKGVLKPGSDADFIIVDPGQSYTIPSTNPHLKVDYCMYEGRQGMGVPVLTMQRGKILSENGQLKAEAGQGKFIAANRIPKSDRRLI